MHCYRITYVRDPGELTIQMLALSCMECTQALAAAFTAGTSSSNGKISGTGPKGVIANGLIWPWLLV